MEFGSFMRSARGRGSIRAAWMPQGPGPMAPRLGRSDAFSPARSLAPRPPRPARTGLDDAERRGRHSHAERGNEGADVWLRFVLVPTLRVGMRSGTLRVLSRPARTCQPTRSVEDGIFTRSVGTRGNPSSWVCFGPRQPRTGRNWVCSAQSYFSRKAGLLVLGASRPQTIVATVATDLLKRADPGIRHHGLARVGVEWIRF